MAFQFMIQSREITTINTCGRENMNTAVREHKRQTDRVNFGSLATSTSVINVILQHFDCRLVVTKQEVAAYIGYSEHTVQKILEKGDTPLNEIFYKAG
jgi:hypothetical protein